MKELVYDSAMMGLITRRWPDAVITDASDMIHDGRFMVELGVTEAEFYSFAISEGFTGACLNFQVTLLEDRHQIRLWLERAKTDHFYSVYGMDLE